ncbi:hypothetical protein NDU88_001303 [Pleurodeles waltl]|uniref:Uncharacterized protein n=1 Tax=Pleurodeles waltl TaxID=8319 RepID=A0AAV7VW22_PLEWA|nr:hypothetical protein NDU88_001303 [Pleurodeles waltl]
MPQPPGYDVNTKRSYSWGSFQFQRRSSTAPKRLHCRIARSHRSGHKWRLNGLRPLLSNAYRFRIIPPDPLILRAMFLAHAPQTVPLHDT